MTQALLNNLTNTTQMLNDVKTATKDVAVGMDFQGVLDKKIDKVLDNAHKSLEKPMSDSKLVKPTETIAKTLGDLKEKTSTKMEEFTNILSGVTKEVAEEDALNLTLEKDIQEVIEDLEITTEIDDEELAENIETTITENDEVLAEEVKNAAVERNIVQQVEVLPAEQTIQLQADDKNQVVADFEAEEELNVTINGNDLDAFLQDFNMGVNVEEVEVNLAQKPAEIEVKTIEDLVDEETLKELNVESVETETSDAGSEDSDLMNYQTPEEQGIKAMLQTPDADFSQVKIEVTQQASASQNTKAPTEVNPSKILEQISKQLENLNQTSKVNIVLNPESLGKVSVQLINTKEGLSAQFTVATQEARNLLMQGLDGLKDTLLSHGVNVDNVSVKINDTQESEYNSDWTEQEGSRGGNKDQNSNKNQKEKQDFEQLMSQEGEK